MSNNEWYTPISIIDMVEEVFGKQIDLDPASCQQANEFVKAKMFYSKDGPEKSLEIPWFGDVFLNPPYENPIMVKFIAKLIHEIAEGNVNRAIVLVHSRTDNKWFHALLGSASSFVLTKGRIRFIDPITMKQKYRNTCGSAIFLLTSKSRDSVFIQSKFSSVFGRLGTVVF